MQIIPQKTQKWGYKLWALAVISGYVYAYEEDGGLGSTREQPPSKLGERVIML